jgi:cysteine-rich repeat protein
VKRAVFSWKSTLFLCAVAVTGAACGEVFSATGGGGGGGTETTATGGSGAGGSSTTSSTGGSTSCSPVDDGNACTADVCSGGQPVHEDKPAGTACAQDGGALCDGKGTCVECLGAPDCPDGASCSEGFCVTPGCEDGAQNGGETDVDCGGIDCKPCLPDEHCLTNTDCFSKVCKGRTCLAPACGDGVKNGRTEQCDDGNATNGDGCDVNCTFSACGNGAIGGEEECDDGNFLNGDGCDKNCTLTSCGNDIQTEGEECDDGNAVSGDGCDSNCTITYCGNGVITPPEECDDGNSNPGDGCDSNCMTEI